MATGNMPQFMGNHALDLIGVVRRLDQAAMDINDLATRNERIDAAIANQNNAHICRPQTRCTNQWLSHFVKQRLSFGITQYLLCLHGAGRHHHGDCSKQHHPDAADQLLATAIDHGETDHQAGGQRIGRCHRKLLSIAPLSLVQLNRA